MNILPYIDKTKPCDSCGGTGFDFDPAELRKKVTAYLRTQNISQNKLAEQLGMSWSYMSLLLTGKRTWNAELVQTLLKVIKP